MYGMSEYVKTKSKINSTNKYYLNGEIEQKIQART